jgi:hypothetical protein
MTTHFTSGVTNVSNTGSEGLVKQPSRHKYHEYFNDFDTYLASDWTITTTEGGSQKFHVYQNNVLAGTVVNTNAPDDEELTLSFGIQNGAAAAKVLTVDYVHAMKERTATTEL